jgi:hypothetical protein
VRILAQGAATAARLQPRPIGDVQPSKIEPARIVQPSNRLRATFEDRTRPNRATFEPVSCNLRRLNPPESCNLRSGLGAEMAFVHPKPRHSSASEGRDDAASEPPQPSLALRVSLVFVAGRGDVRRGVSNTGSQSTVASRAQPTSRAVFSVFSIMAGPPKVPGRWRMPRPTPRARVDFRSSGECPRAINSSLSGDDGIETHFWRRQRNVSERLFRGPKRGWNQAELIDTSFGMHVVCTVATSALPTLRTSPVSDQFRTWQSGTKDPKKLPLCATFRGRL